MKKLAKFEIFKQFRRNLPCAGTKSVAIHTLSHTVMYNNNDYHEPTNEMRALKTVDQSTLGQSGLMNIYIVTPVTH